MNKCEDELEWYLEDVKAGNSSTEDCLDRYSGVREELEPQLRIALEIHKRRMNPVEQI